MLTIITREVKNDVYGNWNTAKIKLCVSLFIILFREGQSCNNPGRGGTCSIQDWGEGRSEGVSCCRPNKNTQA